MVVLSEGTVPRLTDGTVRLDELTPDDVAAHVAGEDEEQARRFGWYPQRSTEETARRAIVEWQEAWRTGGRTRTFAVRDEATGALAGGCQVRLRDDGIAEMSYWIFPDFRGRGFAGRALRLACDWAFAHLGVERMELYIEPDNLASRGVARRAGFRKEGTLRAQQRIGDVRRDMVLYARLPGDD
jgi:RimJ/RimL family protein N-acetyltransferase